MRLALFFAWLAALLLAVLSVTLLLAVPVRVVPLVSIGEVCLVAPLYLVTLAYALVAGLPVAALLCWKNWVHPLIAPAAGLLLGALPAALLQWWTLAVLGAVAAAVFRTILKACGVLDGGALTVRPRLSFVLAVLAVAATALTLSVIPPCEIID